MARPGNTGKSSTPIGDRLKQLAGGLASLGPDHASNIHRLTMLGGELLSAACALYNRLTGGLLCSLGQWSVPTGYVAADRPDGHICYDVIRNNVSEPLLVRHLPSTSYAQTDPNVRAYGLQTYLGRAVFVDGKAVGSLCVVYDRDAEPDQEDLEILSILATAIGHEEDRRQAAEDLQRSQSDQAHQLEELQRWYTATLGRENRVIELKREVNVLCARLGQPLPYGDLLKDKESPPP